MAGSGFGDPFWQLAEYCSVDKIAWVPVPRTLALVTVCFQQSYNRGPECCEHVQSLQDQHGIVSDACRQPKTQRVAIVKGTWEISLTPLCDNI